MYLHSLQCASFTNLRHLLKKTLPPPFVNFFEIFPPPPPIKTSLVLGTLEYQAILILYKFGNGTLGSDDFCNNLLNSFCKNVKLLQGYSECYFSLKKLACKTIRLSWSPVALLQIFPPPPPIKTSLVLGTLEYQAILILYKFGNGTLGSDDFCNNLLKSFCKNVKLLQGYSECCFSLKKLACKTIRLSWSPVALLQTRPFNDGSQESWQPLKIFVLSSFGGLFMYISSYFSFVFGAAKWLLG